MASEELHEDRHPPWSWTQFATAWGMIAASFVLWLVGLDDVFRPQHDPLAGACLIVAPFVGFAGAAWVLFLLVRRFWPGKRRSR